MAARARSAVFVVVVGLVPLVIGGPAFALLMAFLGIMAWREYARIAQRLAPVAGITAGGAIIAGFGAAGLFGWPLPIVAAIAFLGVMLPLIGQFGRIDERDALLAWGLGAAGTLYLGLPVLAATSLRQLAGPSAPWAADVAGRVSLGWPPAAYGFGWALAVVLCTWLADTGAYLVGRAAGRRKLSPRISPNKTIEGAVGGLAGAALAGALCWSTFGLPGGWLAGAGVGIVLGMVGQAGDLAESFVKRQAGVKDSGTMIPGHGGVFDRVDALFVSFPAAWALAALFDMAVP